MLNQLVYRFFHAVSCWRSATKYSAGSCLQPMQINSPIAPLPSRSTVAALSTTFMAATSLVQPATSRESTGGQASLDFTLDTLSLPDANFESAYRGIKAVYPPAILLCKLFCFVKGDYIPESLLSEIKTPRRVWSAAGELEAISPLDAGLNAEIVSYLKDEVYLHWCLSLLLKAEWISIEEGNFGCPLIRVERSIRDHVRARIPDPDQASWQEQGLNLLCYSYPHSPNTDTR